MGQAIPLYPLIFRMLSKPKDRKIAAILAFSSLVLPISGLHKFYLGQTRWGVVYLLLSLQAPFISKVASALEGFWYLFQEREEFDQNFNFLQESGKKTSAAITLPLEPTHVEAVADALRQLDNLRQDGLISEYEFEQKRRQLLDRIG